MHGPPSPRQLNSQLPFPRTPRATCARHTSQIQLPFLPSSHHRHEARDDDADAVAGSLLRDIVLLSHKWLDISSRSGRQHHVRPVCEAKCASTYLSIYLPACVSKVLKEARMDVLIGSGKKNRGPAAILPALHAWLAGDGDGVRRVSEQRNTKTGKASGNASNSPDSFCPPLPSVTVPKLSSIP